MSKVIRLLSRWKEVIIITALIRLGLFILPLFIRDDIGNVFYFWVQWDGPHYIDLARDWYQSFGEQSLWIVFYPLYPLLIKLVNIFINDYSVSSIVLSLGLSFSAAVLLFEVTLLDFNRTVALLSVWFFNIFPTSYFLHASYTESLFLTTSLATIYFFRKAQFISSGLAGLLATATRVNGMLLLPLLALETKSIKKSLITFLLAPVGMISYLLINLLTFNDPFYFLKPLQVHWHKALIWPWVGIKNLFSAIPNTHDVLFYAYASEGIAVIIAFLFSIYVFLRIRKSWGVYMFLNLLLFTSTSFVMSTPRYILILFPIYIVLGKIKNRALFTSISLISIFLLLLFSYFYIQGGWAF